jgi:hypothetical protein
MHGRLTKADVAALDKEQGDVLEAMDLHSLACCAEQLRHLQDDSTAANP